MLTTRHEVQIEFGDCDPAGIVFYPNYFRYFDAATGRLLQAATKLRKSEVLKKYGIAGIPMVNTGAKFHRPCRFGDVVVIETEVVKIGRSSFRIEHKLSHGGELAAEAFEVRVWVGRDVDDPEKIGPKPIPDDVRTAFEG